MSKTDTEVREALPAAKPVWRVRAAVVVIAVAANAIVWMIATAGGVDLEAGFAGEDPSAVGLANVAVMTAVFAVLGWIARAVLDKIAKRRAAAIWLVGASVLLLGSLFPLLFLEATAGAKITLALTHLFAGLPLFPVMGRKQT